MPNLASLKMLARHPRDVIWLGGVLLPGKPFTIIGAYEKIEMNYGNKSRLR